MGQFDGWFGPVPRSDHTATRSALVIMTDVRATIATTLILQELGMSVDVGSEPAYALRWLRQARYDAVVAGGPDIGVADFAAQLREAAPESRVVILPEAGANREEVTRLGVEVLEPPVDVNQLVECFTPVSG